MGKSFRKSPIVGHTTAKSEKEDKKISSGKMRTKTRNLLKKANPEEELFPDSKDIFDMNWSGSKDGKSYLKNPTRKDLRK